jgi:hypothetical protein
MDNSVGKLVEKRGTLYTAGGTIKWYKYFGKQFDSFSKS